MAMEQLPCMTIWEEKKEHQHITSNSANNKQNDTRTNSKPFFSSKLNQINLTTLDRNTLKKYPIAGPKQNLHIKTTLEELVPKWPTWIQYLEAWNVVAPLTTQYKIYRTIMVSSEMVHTDITIPNHTETRINIIIGFYQYGIWYQDGKHCLKDSQSITLTKL